MVEGNQTKPQFTKQHVPATPPGGEEKGQQPGQAGSESGVLVNPMGWELEMQRRGNKSQMSLKQIKRY